MLRNKAFSSSNIWILMRMIYFFYFKAGNKNRIILFKKKERRMMTSNENLIKWVNKELSNLLDFDIGEEYAR